MFKPGDKVKLIDITSLEGQIESNILTKNKVYTVIKHTNERWEDYGGCLYFIGNTNEMNYLKGKRFSLVREIKTETDWLDAVQQNFKEI